MYPTNLIHEEPTRHVLSHDDAERLAADLTADDGEWAYFARPLNEKDSAIGVFDQEGDFLGFI